MFNKRTKLAFNNLGHKRVLPRSTVLLFSCTLLALFLLYSLRTTPNSTLSTHGTASRAAVLLMTRNLNPVISRRLSRLVDAGLDAHVILDIDASPNGPPYGAREHYFSTDQVLKAGFTDLTFNTTGLYF